MREFSVSEKNENERLNKYLSHLLPNASMGFIYKMLRKENITLNGKKASGNELLKPGDEVRIFFSTAPRSAASCLQRILRRRTIWESHGCSGLPLQAQNLLV